MRFARAIALLLLVFSTAVTGRMEMSRWVFLDLGALPGGSFSYGISISPAGEVAGYSYGFDPDYPAVSVTAHAFVWSNGAMRDLGAPRGSGGVQAYGINARGDVIARGSPTTEAYLFRNGAWTDLGFDGTPAAINAKGDIAGSMQIGRERHAVLVKDGVVQELDVFASKDSLAVAINDAGQVVGGFVSPDGFSRSFLWEGGTLSILPLPAETTSSAVDINDQGTILAITGEGSGRFSTYLIRHSMVERILTAVDQTSYVGRAINNRGEVVGVMSLHDKPYEGFYYFNGTLVRLGDLPQVKAAGFRELQANAINDRGWIAGWGRTADGRDRAFLLMRR